MRRCRFPSVGRQFVAPGWIEASSFRIMASFPETKVQEQHEGGAESAYAARAEGSRP